MTTLHRNPHPSSDEDSYGMPSDQTGKTLPRDVQALVNQTIESLQGLVPPSKAEIVSDEIKDAVFSAVDAITADMRELSKVIHGGLWAPKVEERKLISVREPGTWI